MLLIYLKGNYAPNNKVSKSLYDLIKSDKGMYKKDIKIFLFVLQDLIVQQLLRGRQQRKH